MDAVKRDAIVEAQSRAAFPAAQAALVAAIAAAIGWSYWPVFRYLGRWWEDSNYSHGWLVIPIALAICWQRREALAGVVLNPRWWGMIPLGLLLLSRSVLYQRNEQWAEAATLPLVIGAAVLALGGWNLFRWALPGGVFLLFMLPLPPSVNEMLAGKLQSLATAGATTLLQVTGLPVLAEGNVILVKNQRLEVAEACRGLSMLLSFGALITAMVILVRRPIAERVVLVLSIIPIALFCNIVRIAVTGVIYGMAGREVHSAHDYAGYAMMALALGLVVLELTIMAWLFPIDPPAEEGPSSLVRPQYSGSNSGPR